MSKNKVLGRSISLWSTVSTLSISLLILLILSMIGGVALYIFMAIPPARHTRIEDRGDLLSKKEETDILQQLEKIKDSKNINAFVVTKYGEPYGENLSAAKEEEMSHAYAKKAYAEFSNVAFTKDNSGFLILIDLDIRYLYIYTIDRVHACYSDEDCVNITSRAGSYAKEEDYGGAISHMLEDIYQRPLTSTTYVLIQAFRFVGPLLITGFVFFFLTRKKRGKKTTTNQTYLTRTSPTNRNSDIFTHNTVTVTSTSSGSGGGSGGGGGGGGGGRSGGGGSRF